MPMPRTDFDPMEVALSRKVLTGMGHQVAFATSDWRRAAAHRAPDWGPEVLPHNATHPAAIAPRPHRGYSAASFAPVR